MQIHQYKLALKWTGNKGEGTIDYRSYERSHEIKVPGKPTLLASADPAFRGDQGRYNPEELLLASLSGCHMLWFLHLCADDGVQVLVYEDQPEATMQDSSDGGGKFTETILKPKVKVAEKWMLEKLDILHTEANKRCFIANSVNFPVKHEASGYL